jgi:dTDP-glucose pyrophosphorylase
MRYKINLLPPPQLSTIDKAVYFSYNYLRYILVLTQLVVLGVFTYRFTVDQDIVDLKDTLRQKQEIVKVSQPLLNQGATVDNKVRNIKTVIGKQQDLSNMLSYYLSIFPEKISATRLTIQKDGIYLEGVTTDVTVLQSFYSRLQADKRFKHYELRNVQRTATGYTFILTLGKFEV